jgi:hypothetical protein
VSGGKDPAAMRPEDRLAEVAAILTRGYIRVLAARSAGDADPFSKDGIPLALLDPGEPSCSDAVNSRENEEVA